MAMKALYNEIDECVRNSNSDLQLLRDLNQLANNTGAKACQAILEVLADINLNEAEAQQHWTNIQQHVTDLSSAIGRPINLVAAICDYFANSSQYLDTPKLTSIAHFDTLLNDSTYDSLTGLLNRNYFSDTLTQQLALSKRQGSDLSLLFIDLDDFKNINDNYGHQIGDRVLKEVADIIAHAIRQSDIALRYGGEEFVILMPNTPCNSALILGNRIREQIQQHSLQVGERTLNLTVSGGVSAFPSHATTGDDLIRYADGALYRAKGAGKNNISLFMDENRRYLRIPLSEKVQIKALGFSESNAHQGMSKDIAIGGILVVNDQPYAIGSQLQLSITINRPVLLLGTVVRIEMLSDNQFDIGVALSFDEMEKLAKNQISQLLAKSNRIEKPH